MLDKIRLNLKINPKNKKHISFSSKLKNFDLLKDSPSKFLS